MVRGLQHSEWQDDAGMKKQSEPKAGLSRAGDKGERVRNTKENSKN